MTLGFSFRSCGLVDRFKCRRGHLMTKKLGSIIFLILLAIFTEHWANAQAFVNRPKGALSGPETKAERDRRMKWWREARFGMFIHWGLYAVPAGEYTGKRSERIGEWIMEWANIPRADYEKFAPQFNPVKFDAAQWVRIARDAGMKYIVITSKHHDGFSMYGSEISHYDIVDSTPYHKDPIKALAAEAKKQGLKFCFYYSILDWHWPSAYVDEQERSAVRRRFRHARAADSREWFARGRLGKLYDNEYDLGI